MTNEKHRLNELRFSEQFLIWGIRVWVRSFMKEEHNLTHLRDAFKLARAEDAFLPLDGFMTIISSTSEAQIDVRCPKCAELSPDERHFLDLCASAQHSSGAALITPGLAKWLPPTGVRFAEPQLRMLGSQLKRAGHSLPFRHDKIDMSHLANPSNTSDSGSTGLKTQ